MSRTMYAITKVNKDGMRTLAFANHCIPASRDGRHS
jgi:hypothetical protein